MVCSALIYLQSSWKTLLLINGCVSDGNYREYRHFTPWQRPQETEDYYLEQIAGKITGQYKVPFGDAVISTRDTCLGLETCEELFTPNGCVNYYPSLANAVCITARLCHWYHVLIFSKTSHSIRISRYVSSDQTRSNLSLTFSKRR